MNRSVEKKEYIWRCKTKEEDILYSQKQDAILFKLWPVNTNKDYSIKDIEEYRTEALRKYPKEQRKINGFLNALQRLEKEDLIWVDFDETYHLYSVKGTWKYLGNKDYHFLPVKYELKVEKAPGEIKNIFTGGGIIQRRYGEDIIKRTRELITEINENKGEISNTSPKEVKVKEKENFVNTQQKEEGFEEKKKQLVEKPVKDLKRTLKKNQGKDDQVLEDSSKDKEHNQGQLVSRPSGGLRVRNNSVEIYPLNDDVIEKIIKNRKEEEHQEEYQFGDIVIEVYPKEEEVIVQQEEPNYLPVPREEKPLTEYQERYRDFLALREHSIEMAKEHIDYFWNLHYSYLTMEKAMLEFFAEIQKIFFSK
ncbi:MAG: hypothetical protein Q4Q07_08745 [Tissierellia bacterium]|nr:hypothetical protein [Tissierellia bacterium]